MTSFKTIVTGGAGFIGSALVWRLNQLGQTDILIVDDMDDTDKWKNLAPLQFADYLDKYDLVDDLDKFKGVKTILHMGACSSTTETDSAYLMENNYRYTKQLADWSVANGVRFIYASSAATYGDGSNGMADGTDEINTLRPLNMYGYSKQLFDQYAHRNGLFDKIVGLKFFNVFGPNENHKDDMRSLVNKAYDQIRETGVLKLFRSASPDYKDGEFGRDFVYVKDAINMALHFIENPASGLFNVGSGQMHTWNELAAAIFSALGKEPAVEFIDMPVHLRDRYQYHTQANLKRIRETGYISDTTDLNEAVSDYVQNYLMPGKYLGD
jgi:ADP-L-glycero-D-manno-heptose 6-epimerase